MMIATHVVEVNRAEKLLDLAVPKPARMSHIGLPDPGLQLSTSYISAYMFAMNLQD